MPLYPFACSSCGAEFDVERAPGDLDRPTACPADGAAARRVYGVTPAVGASRTGVVPFGSFWHDHGPETEPHLHGTDSPARASETEAR